MKLALYVRRHNIQHLSEQKGLHSLNTNNFQTVGLDENITSAVIKCPCQNYRRYFFLGTGADIAQCIDDKTRSGITTSLFDKHNREEFHRQQNSYSLHIASDFLLYFHSVLCCSMLCSFGGTTHAHGKVKTRVTF